MYFPSLFQSDHDLPANFRRQSKPAFLADFRTPQTRKVKSNENDENGMPKIIEETHPHRGRFKFSGKLGGNLGVTWGHMYKDKEKTKKMNFTVKAEEKKGVDINLELVKRLGRKADFTVRFECINLFQT